MAVAATRPLWIRNPLDILADDAGGGIVVRGGVIAELVPAGAQPQGFEPSAFEVHDASQQVVLPGLVSTHHHFFQTLTRAHRAAINKPLFPWLQALFPVWRHLTPDLVAVSTRLVLAESLLSGCTTVADHHYVFPHGLEEAVDIQADEVRRAGIRATLTRGSMSLSVEDGGLPPRTLVQDEDVILAESERLIKRHHETGPGAMIQIALAPCSPFACTAENMRDTAALARANRVRLHTHIAETTDETEFCLSTFGMSPVDFLDSVNWIGDDVWVAHGIHFSDDDVAQLGQGHVGVCHCPTSNMLLASGVCPTLDLEDGGAVIGLGVDGSSSNDCSNMMQEVRQALLLQRLRYGAERVDHLRVLDWATRGSARCLGREDIGEIAVGKRADLALFRLDALRFSGAQDPLAALVLCGAHRADAVMVEGRWRVVDGALCNIDERALRAEHHAAAERLWRAAG